MKATGLNTALIVTLVSLIGSGHLAQAQEGEPAVAGLEEGWSQLPAADFLDQVSQLTQQGPLSDEARITLRAHAASLLTETDLVRTEADYRVIDQLHRLGGEELSDVATTEMRDILLSRQDNWQGRDYEDLRAKVEVMRRIEVSFETLRPDVIQWIQLGGDLSEIRPSDVGYLRFFLPTAKLIEKNFSIRWEGKVSAPQTGAYTFSVSPININTEFGSYFVRKTMTVAVDGQVVVSATPDDWAPEGSPVNLVQDQPVTLRVDLTVESSELVFSVLHATLLWEGPGVTKSVVPTTRLTLSDGETPGLQAAYSWKVGKQQQSAVQVESNIDFVWPVGRVAIGASSQFMVDNLAAQWQQAIDPAFLNTLTGPPVKEHPLLKEPVVSAGDLTSAQRRQFLEVLLARPDLLDVLNLEQATELYRAYRVGAEDAALDVFGTWAARHADYACEMPIDPRERNFDFISRMAVHRLGVCVGHELPSHSDRLRDEYLVLEDGSCCLPVAYTLATSYRVQGKIAEWIEILEGYLNDPANTGDRRINWLLARAFAGSNPQGPTPPFFYFIGEHSGTIREWLDEASLVASSPAEKVRVARERAARFAFAQRFDEAREELQKATDAASPDLSGDVAKWKKDVDAFETAHNSLKAERAIARKKAFVDAYTELRDSAATTGDADAVDRYNTLIEAAAAK